MQAISWGDNGIFCIGTGRAVSIKEIYKTLAQLTGYEPEITKSPKRAGDIYQSYFNVGKAERLLNWNAL